VEAKCESPGTPLRAPTADRGLDVYCRDSFYGEVCHIKQFIASLELTLLQICSNTSPSTIGCLSHAEHE